jgi:hypothetical protein
MRLLKHALPGMLVLTAAAPALAGYVAVSGLSDPVIVSDSTISTGDTLIVNSGTFSNYQPDGLSDPQIAGDLPRYGWTLNATAGSQSGGIWTYSGNYVVFYDVDNDDLFDDATDYHLSKGLASFTVQPVLNLSTIQLTVTAGQLNQSQGPELPSTFADISYGNPIGFGGTITINNAAPANSSTALTFTAVPEPAALGLLGMGALALVRRKRCV